MITRALSRNGETAPLTSDSAADSQREVNENAPGRSPPSPAQEKGYTTENGHSGRPGKHRKRHKRMARPVSSSPAGASAAKTTEETRPALAVFCWEHPDTPIGKSVAETVAALGRRKQVVHLFSRQPFGIDVPGVHAHPVGESGAADFLGQVQEFTSQAANAFLQRFPGGSPHVTLMGYEWSGAGPLGLLRGLKNSHTIFSISSLERQRSDMTSEISKRIDELEQTTLRESQVVLSQGQTATDAARFWVPECAARIVASRQPFPIESFDNKVDAGQVKARFQVGPIDPTILFVGDFSERYGPDLLVKAMPAVLKNHSQARLILVGDGAQYWTLRVYSRYLLLDHAIRFPGSVVGQAMNELVEAADVIVVPSRESTPWWPIQAAWAAGRPVVATHPAAPGLLEHERDSLLVYPVEQSIVWGIERILYDAKLGSTLGQHGHSKLEERFGWNHVAEQIEDLMGVAVQG
jgi:glycosyltransferase involved in cell wall biosynthesis